MIGNYDRVIFFFYVMFLFDMIVLDEMDFCVKMLCGYVISKNENKNIYSKY